MGLYGKRSTTTSTLQANGGGKGMPLPDSAEGEEIVWTSIER